MKSANGARIRIIDVIKEFTGFMQPGNYEIFRDSAAAHGLLPAATTRTNGIGRPAGFNSNVTRKKSRPTSARPAWPDFNCSTCTITPAREPHWSVCWTRFGNQRLCHTGRIQKILQPP